MHWHEMLIWAWHALKHAWERKKGKPESPKKERETRQEDGECVGKVTPTTIRIWEESDAKAVQDLPPGPAHIRFVAADFWECIRGGNAIGIVAEQAQKVIGVLVTMKKKNQSSQIVVRFAVTAAMDEEQQQEIGAQLLEFMATLVQPLPQAPIVVEVHESTLTMHRALEQASFVATAIQRNQPAQGESIYVFQRPPHIKWKKGRIRIIDGNSTRMMTAPTIIRT